MSKAKLDTWLKDAQRGVVSIPQLEQLKVPDAVTALSSLFPHKLMERHLDHLFEVGFAETHEAKKEKGKKADRQATHFYLHCVFLTSDSGTLSGITIMGRLQYGPSPDKKDSFDVASGSGVSVFKSPDGWVVKSLEEKTVSLNESVFTKRGWIVPTR